MPLIDIQKVIDGLARGGKLQTENFSFIKDIDFSVNPDKFDGLALRHKLDKDKIVIIKK